MALPEKRSHEPPRKGLGREAPGEEWTKDCHYKPITSSKDPRKGLFFGCEHAKTGQASGPKIPVCALRGRGGASKGRRQKRPRELGYVKPESQCGTAVEGDGQAVAPQGEGAAAGGPGMGELGQDKNSKRGGEKKETKYKKYVG